SFQTFNTTDASNVINITLNGNDLAQYVNASNILHGIFEVNSTTNYTLSIDYIWIKLTFERPKGNWTDTNLVEPTGNTVKYQFSASWPIRFDLNWSINFTRDLLAPTTFHANISESTVVWNATLNLTKGEYFPSQTENHVVEILLPVDWNVTDVFNETVNYTDTSMMLEDGFKKLTIWNVSQNSWIVRCLGYNYINSSSVYRGGEAIQESQISDQIMVSASLRHDSITETLENGNLTLYFGVDKLHEEHVAANAGYLNFSSWYLYERVISEGEHDFRIYWNNGTEVGLSNAPLNITIPPDFMYALGNGDPIDFDQFQEVNKTTTGNHTTISVNTDGWNLTSIEMNISNIIPADFNKTIEDQGTTSKSIADNTYAMQFNFSGSAYLEGFRVQLVGAFTDYLNVSIWNATWNGSYTVPDAMIWNYTYGSIGTFFGSWADISVPHVLLNLTQTKNQSFFIALNASSGAKSWEGVADSVDSGKVYQRTGSSWTLDENFDLSLITWLNSAISNPTPSQINLKINNVSVQDMAWGGFWEENTFRATSDSSIIFNVSCNWENLTFDVNWTANLTKNSKFAPYYRLEANALQAEWNVTAFDLTFTEGSVNRIINVSLPIDWNLTHVLRDYTEHQWVQNGTEANKRYVIISNASDATWRLSAVSPNYVTGITYWIDNSAVSFGVIGDNMTVNASMIVPCNSPIGNLSVKLGSMIINRSSSTPNGYLAFNLPLNEISNFTTNGTYTFEVRYANGTEVGFANSSFTVLNKTTLTAIKPSETQFVVDLGTPIELEMNYTMEVWTGSAWETTILSDTMNANVTVENGSVWSPLTYQASTKTWNCSLELPYQIGSYEIKINASKPGTEMQNLTLIVQVMDVSATITGQGDKRDTIISGILQENEINGNNSQIVIDTNGFNVSSTNLTIYETGIFHDQVVEKDVERLSLTTFNISSGTYAMQYNISHDEYISGIKFALDNTGQATGINKTSIYIWNSSWDMGNNRPAPDQLIWSMTDISTNIYVPNGSPLTWVNITLPYKTVFLQSNNTDNNSYFITVNGTPYDTTSPLWAYAIDDDTIFNYNDEVPEGLAYQYTGSAWELAKTILNYNIDLTLIVENVTYKAPDDPAVNLKINGTAVNGTGGDTGNWINSTFTFPAESSGHVIYDVQSSDPAVRYKVNATLELINTNPNRTTTYLVNGTGTTVTWNISVLNNIPSNAQNVSMNITVPPTWNVLYVLNPSQGNHTNWTFNPVIQVQDMGTTTGYWTILCNSSKLPVNDLQAWLNDSGTYQAVEEAYMNQKIKFNASISGVMNGLANITIQALTHNMSNILNTTPINGEFNFPEWDIWNYLRRDGNNTVLFTWSNGSEVAANVTYLYVYNATDLLPSTPGPSEINHVSGNNYRIKELGETTFNLTVYFNMSWWNSSTSQWEDNGVPLDSDNGASVTYKCNFGPTENRTGSFSNGYFGAGKWNGTFTAPSSSGDYYIEVTASLGAPYQPVILNFTLTLTNLTSLVISPETDSIYWLNNVTFEVNYTNLDSGSPVLNADITIETSEGTLQESVNYTVVYNSGIYNVTIISSTLHARIYSLNFSVTTNETQLQRKIVTLTVLNRTTILQANQTTFDVYLGDNFTVYLTYKDAINDTEIAWDTLVCLNNSALVFTSFGGPGNYSTTINSSIMLEGTILNTTGVHELVFRATKQDYMVADLTITVNISALHAMLSFVITPESSISYDGQYVIQVVKGNTNHQVIVYYNDSWGYSGVGIGDGSVNATLNGSSLFASSSGTGNYTIRIDATVLSNPPAPSNHTLIIVLSRPGYETKTITAIVEIIELNMSCVPINSSQVIFYPVGQNWTFSMILNRTVTFNVSCNSTSQNITGATVTATLNGSSCLVSEQGNGLYSIIVDSSVLVNPNMTENYTLLIQVDATGYKQVNLTIFVQLEPIPVLLTSLDPELIGYGSETLTIKCLAKDNESNILQDLISKGYGEINFTIKNSTYPNGIPLAGASGTFSWN
ncbi:MAG: hypothetical protein ACXQS8_03950, partial [Candidatus Helarchaeales archaeon]